MQKDTRNIVGMISKKTPIDNDYNSIEQEYIAELFKYPVLSTEEERDLI